MLQCKDELVPNALDILWRFFVVCKTDCYGGEKVN